MPVSIDTVYQRVLTLANKEQRGYITPQEFNLFANQAQMEIFEQYFYDIKEMNRIRGNDEEYSDPLNTLYEKISFFEVQEDNAWMVTNMPLNQVTYFEVPWELIYKIGTIRINTIPVDLLNRKDFENAMRLPITVPTSTRPIGNVSNRGVQVAIGNNNFILPNNADFDFNIEYIRRPVAVQWAYVIVNDKALYNDFQAVDFELHSSEETELVYRILKLSGINLKAAEIVQVGQTLEQTQIQQEKK